MCINTHVSRAVSFWCWACAARTVSHFKWCDRPPTRRVSIAPGTVAVRCETRAPVTCPGATFKGPDLHNTQGSVSGRPAASSRTQPGAAIATSYELTQGCAALRTDVYSQTNRLSPQRRFPARRRVSCRFLMHFAPLEPQNF